MKLEYRMRLRDLFSEAAYFESMKSICLQTKVSPMIGASIVTLCILPVFLYLASQTQSFFSDYFTAPQFENINVMFIRHLIGDPTLKNVLAMIVALFVYDILLVLSHILTIKKKVSREYAKNLKIVFLISNNFLLVPVFSYLSFYIFKSRVTVLVADIFIKIATVCLLLINLICVNFSSRLLNDYQLNTDCSLSRPQTSFLFVDKFVVHAFVFVDIFVPDEYKNEAVVHVALVFSLCILYGAFWLPYHNLVVNMTSKITAFCFFWTSFILLLRIYVTLGIIANNLPVALLIGYMFFYPIIYRNRDWYRDMYINKPNSTMHSEIAYHLKFRFLFDLLKNSSHNKTDEIRIKSLIKIHTMDCRDIACPCKAKGMNASYITDASNSEEKMKLKYSLFIKIIILPHLKDGISKFDDSALLNIDKILVYNQLLNNVFLANSLIFLMQESQKSRLSHLHRFIFFCEKVDITNQIERFGKTHNKLKVDITQIKDYDFHIDTIK